MGKITQKMNQLTYSHLFPFLQFETDCSPDCDIETKKLLLASDNDENPADLAAKAAFANVVVDCHPLTCTMLQYREEKSNMFALISAIFVYNRSPVTARRLARIILKLDRCKRLEISLSRWFLNIHCIREECTRWLRLNLSSYLARRRPAVHWKCRCRRCGSSFSAGLGRLWLAHLPLPSFQALVRKGLRKASLSHSTCLGGHR